MTCNQREPIRPTESLPFNARCELKGYTYLGMIHILVFERNGS